MRGEEYRHEEEHSVRGRSTSMRRSRSPIIELETEERNFMGAGKRGQLVVKYLFW